MDAESITTELRDNGIDGAASLAGRLVALWAKPSEVPDNLVRALVKSPDPELCLAHLEALALKGGRVADRLSGLEPARIDDLCAILGSSERLGRFLVLHKEWLTILEQALAASMPASSDLPTAKDFEQLQKLVRGQCAEVMFSIGARDIVGRATLEETMGQLSRLASSSLEAACLWVRAQLEREYGEITASGGKGAGQSGFVVLGMGKLGGGELNFSSDIDLIYLYENDEYGTEGGPRGRLSAREFFTRMAENVTRAINALTPDGRVFRVDLRLRPDGVNGPVVNSLAGALSYYETWGQTWERSALVKAQPVAGSIVLGRRFLTEISPFIYRRYLDYTTVEDMKEMKGRIEASLRERRGMSDVKLGRGGIREIEFVVHTLQLLHGGKDGKLRCSGTLRTIEKLVERRYLNPESGKALGDAYRFLRDVEHKIQLLDERQSQKLPTGKSEVTLARRLGYHLDSERETSVELAASAVSRFRSELSQHAERVHSTFEALFYSPAAEIKQRTDQRLALLLDELEQEERALWKLQELGMSDTAAAYRELKLLRDGPPQARATPRRRKLLRALAPALLSEIAKSPNPDQALRNITRFFGAVGARSTFLSLLLENPSTMRLLVRLFGASEYLSNFLISHPELLDSLVRADLARVTKQRHELAKTVAREIRTAGSYEARLDALRRFHNEEVLRIGVNEIDGSLKPAAVSQQLTDLAEVCLAVATELARAEALARFGWLGSASEFAIIGMGKLGGRELTYNSDLDIIFVYSSGGSAGDLGVGDADPHLVFTKLAQKIITTLQAPTGEGIVYRIDTRLRPSGKSGPLVCSLDSFASYHATSSQIWERQALIKARVVVGERALAGRIEEIISRFVYGRSLSLQEVEEIHRIRMRMERELARERFSGYNIKTGRGGLVDIEFLVQMLQLRFGHRFPALRVKSTLGALQALGRAGVLAEAQLKDLTASYSFLLAIASALRIERDKAVEALEAEGERVASLARRLGYGGEPKEAVSKLLSDYRWHRERIRAHYTSLFASAEAW